LTSGDFIIEEVQDPVSEKFILRRLIFMSNRNLIQSEARRLTTSNSESPEFDFSYLACGHHSAMVAALIWSRQFLEFAQNPVSSKKPSAALIGHGGGLFPMYLHETFPNLHLECVELDPAVVQLSQQFFGFLSNSDRLVVSVCDGLDWVKRRSDSDTKIDLLMVDVDSKNLSSGLSCPPPAFVEMSFFQSIHSALSPGGLFLLNLVCRSKSLFDEILNRARSVFKFVHQMSVPDDVNVVVICIGHVSSSSELSVSEVTSSLNDMKLSDAPHSQIPAPSDSLLLNQNSRVSLISGLSSTSRYPIAPADLISSCSTIVLDPRAGNSSSSKKKHKRKK
jgi:hypothetical protein